MPEKVNLFKNADFALGKTSPRHWQYDTSDGQFTVTRTPEAGVEILSDGISGSLSFSQECACSGETFYRIEATVTCELSAKGEQSGIGLEVQPIKNGEPIGRAMESPTLHHADQPISISTVYQTADSERRIRVSVFVRQAKGRATIHSARLIKMIEPDATSHPLAIPAPKFALEEQRRATSVLVCSDSANDRPLTSILRSCLGESLVSAAAPAEFDGSAEPGEAILLPDSDPPRAIGSVTSLLKLAKDRIVVISPPAFKSLAGDALSLRRVEQDDDPICARIMYANYATNGFALRDVFPFACNGKQESSFAQHQFRKTKRLAAFCEKHGLETLLWSMCDKEATSDKPISFFKLTEGGALFVLDLQPVEISPTTFGSENLAVHLLCSILGLTQSGIGCYTYAASSEADFRSIMRDMRARFEPFDVQEQDVPIEDVQTQLVTIGSGGDGFGLPLQPRPLILLRTNLASGQTEAAYGALYWIKQLIRMPPYECLYANELCGAFRISWIPSDAAWEAGEGFQRSNQPARHASSIVMDGAPIAALIDVVSAPVNRMRVILPSLQGPYSRYVRWLPQLNKAFPPGRFYAHDVPVGKGFQDRRLFAWRQSAHRLEVVADEQSHDSTIHHEVIGAGGQSIRIEVPGHDGDAAARSIERTAIVANLIEHTVGMQYGLIAVNRSDSPAAIEGLPPVPSGEALVIDESHPVLCTKNAKAG